MQKMNYNNITKHLKKCGKFWKWGGGTLVTKLTRKLNGIIYTAVMLLLLLAAILGIVRAVYDNAEKEAFSKLDLETMQYKRSISVQIASDRENLTSMASLIGEKYDISEYTEVCQSFKATGLCTDIGLLVPGDILITKRGELDVSGKLSFEEEKLKGSYISGRMNDVTGSDKDIIRNVVPVADKDGNIKAMLFGIISADDMTKYYRTQVSAANTFLCIVEGDSYNFVIDTKNAFTDKNIKNLANVKYKDGYGYSKLQKDIKERKAGYSSFVANDSNEYLYVRYDSLGIEDWCIILAQPESVVLANAYIALRFVAVALVVICLIILLYVLGVILSNRKKTKASLIASSVRKSLLEMNQNSDGLTDALRKVAEYAKSRSAFASDSYEEEYNYIMPENAAEKLKPDEIRYFNDRLLFYTARNRTTHGANMYSSKMQTDRKMKEDMPEFYDFMVAHNIHSIIYNVVVNDNSTMYVLGVLNPKNKNTDYLLNKIAVCFSMALYNRKHLEKTQKMALMDSLTGTKNRAAFSQDIKKDNYINSDYTCVYVDVNELNYFNNKYGHAAGDQMLRFIGENLINAFRDSDVYRMGGDEFLIINYGASYENVVKRLKTLNVIIEGMKYHIAVGVKSCEAGYNLEDAVNHAEKEMYQNKARYYQDKELGKLTSIKDRNVVLIKSGISEIDACLSVMSMRYLGIYLVSLEKDSCVSILAPEYFKNIDDQTSTFSSLISRYIYEFVKPEYQRGLLNFLEYDILKAQFSEGHIPEASYERVDGESVTLKIYPIKSDTGESNCIYVFEKRQY